MSDNLHGWLDVSGPEFDYLGHFRAHEWLCEGHNDLGIEEQIDAGNIPDLHMAGKNYPADAEPGNIAQMGNAGSAAGGQTNTTAMQSSMPKTGGGRSLGSSLLNSSGAMDEDFSGGINGAGADVAESSGGVGTSLAGIFGL